MLTSISQSSASPALSPDSPPAELTSSSVEEYKSSGVGVGDGVAYRSMPLGAAAGAPCRLSMEVDATGAPYKSPGMARRVAPVWRTVPMGSPAAEKRAETLGGKA